MSTTIKKFRKYLSDKGARQTIFYKINSGRSVEKWATPKGEIIMTSEMLNGNEFAQIFFGSKSNSLEEDFKKIDTYFNNEIVFDGYEYSYFPAELRNFIETLEAYGCNFTGSKEVSKKESLYNKYEFRFENPLSSIYTIIEFNYENNEWSFRNHVK